MFNCDNLLHPFQNDPGTSQRQRTLDQLVSASVKIDGRSLADLLNYFSDLSTGINYYDTNLAISDWQPFFRQSLPFLLASISRFDYDARQEKFEFYKLLFGKAVSSSGLQLIIHFVYYNTIYKIDNWYEEVQDRDLSIKATLEELIRNKLSAHLKTFILLVNASAKWFGTKRIDFSPLLHTGENNIWELSLKDIHSVNDSFMGEATGRCEQMKLLFEKLIGYFSSFIEAVKLLTTVAANDIPASLVPAGDELKKNHPPHLALIFAFIRLFQKMQDELNNKTKEHLKYFYTEVLQIKPHDAEPDKANIVFEVQKILQDQYQKYLLKKGTELNGGRDTKNADIVFDTDDEIIVNETQIADLRTLFLNNEPGTDKTFVEGIYIAPAAVKADGVDKDFKDDDPKNWFTLGRNISKYTGPGKTIPKPYPSARLGFVLTSPVLYLKEGKRTVDITIDCTYEDSICNAEEALCKSNNGNDCPEYPDFYTASYLFPFVKDFLADATGTPISYIVISSQILQSASEAGMSSASVLVIKNQFLLSAFSNTCTKESRYEDFIIVKYSDWNTFINLPAHAAVLQEAIKLPDLFKKKYPFKIYFSGEKEWVEPTMITKLQLVKGTGNQFNFLVSAELGADKPSVTFYNKENLGEDLGTEMPAVKIELDDLLKLKFLRTLQPLCCLEKKTDNEPQYVSLYHFFRNVTVRANTKINVTVCGLKNFIVQNDENPMNVNSAVYPFGTRPEIVDFDIVNPANPPLVNPNLIGPNFYIGSQEVFCKKWKYVRINLNWKDKPTNFREYYKAYVLEDEALQLFGLDENKFMVRISSLQNGVWAEEAANRKLFDVTPSPALPPIETGGTAPCPPGTVFAQGIILNSTSFPAQSFTLTNSANEPFTVNTVNGFIKINLRGQDFLHKDYSFVLARQMMALGRYPDAILEGAVYKKDGNTVIVFRSIGKKIVELRDEIVNSQTSAQLTRNQVDNLNLSFDAFIGWPPPPPLVSISDPARDALIPLVHDSKTRADDTQQKTTDTKNKLDELQSVIDIFDLVTGQIVKPLTVLIPNEPWTPIISSISLDYTATATVEDISLIHLYPFTGTYKVQQIDLNPTLFPTFCDEGTLFVGLIDLQPANNLNILFQFAEATADSETETEEVHWHYLDNNAWRPLRKGFEVLEDGTLNLTSTGIVKFSLPENMTKDNTIMPSGLHWIKACMAKNSTSASETLNIYTQAISATFAIKDSNDTSRLSNPLPGGSIAKLLVADPAIKKVDQPYETFDGRLTELDGGYYIRVSELLRHKGRAIQKWDYERLVLEEFPQIYKAKCINHSFHTNAHLYDNDIPYAPGYVMLALIPDLTKLKAGNSYEPKVPVSLLEKTELYLKKITSPFVRLKAANPRYEKVNFCLTIRLIKGKDKNYFTEQLKTDLRQFLAPWAVGTYDKLSFGQCVYRSDILRFLELTGYVDFIAGFRMTHENDPFALIDRPSVCPLSPRSILVAGEIDVLIDDPACDEWCYRAEGVNPCDGAELIHNYCK